MSRSYRPTIPVSYIAQVLGFTNEVSDEKDMDCCLEECVEWLKAHGACLILANSEGMQLDAKVYKKVTCKSRLVNKHHFCRSL